MARILLAELQVCMPQFGAALQGHEVLQATKLQEAERLIIEDGIELFVIGIHFDDSRAIELVKIIRLDKKHKRTPILIVRVTPSEIASFLRQTMDTMKSLRAIEDYLELEDEPLKEEKIRDAVANHLKKDKVAQNEKQRRIDFGR